MKHIVIDTNVIVNAFVNEETTHRDFLGHATTAKRFGIALDDEQNIEKEYRKNAQKSVGYRKWWQRLHSQQAFMWVSGKLQNSHCEKLISLGCHEPSDHVFVAVAIKTDKYLISEDSDFGKGLKGDSRQEVLKYIQNKVGVQVLDVIEACEVFANGVGA